MPKRYPWRDWLQSGSRIINRDEFGQKSAPAIRTLFYRTAEKYGRKVSVGIARTWIRVTVTEDRWVDG